ncbi:hypothetical protein IT575_00875 [bacterium]|nr:hypothetical protein [bacterium]
MICLFVLAAPARSAEPPAKSGGGLIRPLDDQANPYRAQYCELDHWLAAHLSVLSSEEIDAFVKHSQTPEAKALRESRPEGLVAVRCYADQAGWLVPFTLQRKALRDPDLDESVNSLVNYRYLRAQHEKEVEAWKQRHTELFSAGVMDEKTAALYHQGWGGNSMPMPRIPAWIGNRPPIWMIAVPNGEYLVCGALGLHFIGEDHTTQYSFLYPGPSGQIVREPIYRYSAEGQLLQTIWEELELGSGWMGIYWPELNSPEFILQRQDGTHRFHGNSSVAIVKGGPGGGDAITPQEIVAAYDFDGTPIDPYTPFPPERRGMGQPVFRDQIKEAFASQCASGLVDPAQRSPYEGRPDGPVVAPEGPQPWPVVAFKPSNPQPGSIFWGGMPKPFTKVAELDAPGNPYAGQYQPWDSWIRENANRDNPRQQQRWQDGRAKRSELEQAAKLAGRELDDTDRAIIRRIENDPSDPWRRFYVEVEAGGWQVPALLDFERRWQRLGQQDLRLWNRGFDDGEWELKAGGDMPADLQAQYDEALNALRAQRYPLIPDWLVAAPVQQACFMPNGDVITRGPLGAWDPDDSKDYWDRAALVEKSWYRYSPDGTLLGSLPQDSAPWCAFYNMSMLAQHDAEKAAGRMIFDYRGVWLSLAQNSGELFAAWDWNGMPLAIDQPIIRPQAWGSWLLWPDMQAVHAAQRKSGMQAQHLPSASWPCARQRSASRLPR